MAALHHVPLFHPRLVRERVARLPSGLFRAHEKTLKVWLEHLRSGALDDTKETSLHGGFLERIFGDVLGYATMATACEGKWDLVAEKTVLSGGSADGAIGSFAKDLSHVVAPIELKGATQFLEHAKGRSLTPIQQGWDYANKTPESRWVIVSNYRETRLYAKSRGLAAYEVFQLEDLAKERGFLRFVALMGRDAMLGGPARDTSPLSDMLVASERTEREITEKLYSEYRRIRARLFEELLRVHSNHSADELLGKAQTILDRVLFIAFAEDRQLVPPNTLAKAFEHRDPYNPRSVWKNFLAVFRSVDEGNPQLNIPAYNGGLFRDLASFEELKISDEICAELSSLGEYDFGEDVSVDVLGHIFEQSITDLEQLRRDAHAGGALSGAPSTPSKARKKPSKRKVEGIFYTPAFVTSFLVRETLGHAMKDAWGRAGGPQATNKKTKIAAWQAYQDELRTIRVLDPACGSGAFLVAVFDALAQEFERANRTLAEMSRQQASLFDLTKTVLNENLFGIDKSGESVEISKLSLWLKTAERGKRLTFLDRNIRQGNSVVSDPQVDPWAFDWASGHVARSFLEPEPPEGSGASEIDARWRGGFDVVIGNPPYVRQELLTDYKGHFGTAFQVYDGTADLFVYFFERGIRQLKPGGRLGFIVSNKWLRGGYARKLRQLFAKECTIESIVDFGHAPVFPDADAFPCIITLRKRDPAEDHEVQVTLYPREELGKELIASYVDTHRFGVRQGSLDDKGWTLEPPSVQALLEKLRARGVPLGEYAGIKPYRGVLTGFNQAFLVNQATKERLCREHASSTRLLKKYIRGQDVGRWCPEWKRTWMIFARRGIDIDQYPAIRAHLASYRERLEPRPKAVSGRGWPGRKPGNYKWYEIQDAVDYYPLLEGPKIFYQEIQFHPQYAFDIDGLYSNNKAFFLPTGDQWLLAVLNSPAMWWHNWRYLVHMKDEALSPAGVKMVSVPIPRPNTEQLGRAACMVATVADLTRTNIEGVAAVLDVLRMEYEVDKPGRMLGKFDRLSCDKFVMEVKKRRRKGAVRLSAAGLSELRQVFYTDAPPILTRTAQILELERRLADTVHEAWGLDADDLATLRATAPPRMPPGW